MAYAFLHEKEMKEACRIPGVDQSAKTTDIHKAYRRLAKKYHPDINPDDPKAGERFKAVQWAYEPLRKPADKGRNISPFGIHAHDTGYDDQFVSFFQYIREQCARGRAT